MIKILKREILKKDNRGFTLLFAILVAILVLAVGTSIINIALKQVILSGAGRESQFAFYAANSGLECALYWDLNGSYIDESGQPKYVFPPPNSDSSSRRVDLNDVYCGGTNIMSGISEFDQDYTTAWITESVGDNRTIFRIVVSNDVAGVSGNLYCAEVTVTKSEVADEVYTRIESQGLNTCDPEGNARAVQRGLVLEYRS